MLSTFDRNRRSQTRGTSRRKLQPSLEGLEDRKLLYATLGDSWSQTARITFSFVPDGTNVGGLSSNLFSTLNQQGTTAAWQLAFQKAAAAWSSYAHINVAQVSDNGAEIGGTGNQQGDPNFGDIRISMVNEGANGTLASTFLPPKANGGSVAGDIVFNSSYTFKLNDDYDLQSVALHELGHALGLGHSADTTADMYPYYSGVNQIPRSDDIAGIQAVYGAYPSDTDANKTINTATNITPLLTANRQISIGTLNLAGYLDLDWFSVTVPSGTTGSMVVTMQANALSSVAPRVTIYNGAKVGLVQFINTTPGGNATVTVSGVTAGQVFYIRASSGASPGTYGAYGLLVNFGSASQPPIAPPNTAVAATVDQGGGGLGEILSDGKRLLGNGGGSVGPQATRALAGGSSVEAIAEDVHQLLLSSIANGDTSSPQFKHLVAIRGDINSGNMNKLKTDLKVVLADAVQVGGLAAYGDNLYVKNLPVSKLSSPNHADPSVGTFVLTPSATSGVARTAAHHPKGVQPLVLSNATGNHGRSTHLKAFATTALRVNHRGS